MVNRVMGRKIGSQWLTVASWRGGEMEEGPGGLDVTGREGTPGVNDSLVGDERGGHRPNSKHLSDGGLQQDKAVPVTDTWCAIETYILVDIILDPLLQLRARTGWMLPGCLSPGEARV